MEKTDASSGANAPVDDFREKSQAIKTALNQLLDTGVFKSSTYVNLLIRLLEARTTEDLDRLAHDIAELCKEG